MKTLMLTMAAVMIATLAVTADPISAATSNGPYYATPAWDQQLQCDTSATCPRFIVLSNWGNAAVLDRETGLVWEQSPDPGSPPGTPFHSFESAQVSCNIKTVGNRLGWRLPTIQELASLVDPTVPVPGPTLPAGHPFSNVQSSGYWSATTSNATCASNAWRVRFSDGFVSCGAKAGTFFFFVWCVRGGHGVDPQ